MLTLFHVLYVILYSNVFYQTYADWMRLGKGLRFALTVNGPLVRYSYGFSLFLDTANLDGKRYSRILTTRYTLNNVDGMDGKWSG